MNDGWAALLFRAAEVDDERLSLGFAIALAGYDVERPRLEIAALDGLPGWSVAFYASGIRAPGHGPAEEVAHQRELFTGEGVTPAIGVRLAAQQATGADVEVHSIVHFAAGHVDVGESFGREGEDLDPEPMTEDLDAADDLDGADDLEPGEDGDDAEDDDEEPASLRLARAFGRPVLADLARALFSAGRTVIPRLVSPEPEAVREATSRLVATLGRVVGRGATLAPNVGAAVPPASYAAFAATYDFRDPTDPRDLYRELAIGRIRGTLRFFRGEDERPTAGTERGLYPIGELLSSSLSEPKRVATLALRGDGTRLALVTEGGRDSEAGPTFAELIRYLGLGFSRRSSLEEEIIGALMLRAAVRVA